MTGWQRLKLTMLSIGAIEAAVLIAAIWAVWRALK